MNNIIYNIEEQFRPSTEFQELYLLYKNMGLEFCKDQKILVLSIVRNIASEYKFALRSIKDLMQYFDSSSRVCIYENDSIDRTPQLIQEHLSKHDGYQQFSIRSEVLDTAYMPLSKSKTRTTNLAKARNKCYEFGTKLIKDMDFVLVIDMDFVNISISGLLNSFGWLHKNPNISAICGNSYIDMSNKHKTLFHNYDSFAFRLNYWEYYDPLWFPFFDLPIGSPPIPVYSGFGGCCIYRQQYYLPLYAGEDCEHVMLHKNLKLKNNNFSLYYNPSQILIVN